MSTGIAVSPPSPPPPAPTLQPSAGQASSTEFNALAAHLQTKYGLSPGQVTTLIGSSPAVTRQQTEQAITAWAKTLPKAT